MSSMSTPRKMTGIRSTLFCIQMRSDDMSDNLVGFGTSRGLSPLNRRASTVPLSRTHIDYSITDCNGTAEAD
ncbi:hypothetical protein EYF80_044426 [Liparis tanakae]|uniref:Uncharacterized protein n=1 Tax=Liparis tanakae TaxID=230148 RepID=A0A4Z2FVX1_9TELE|nr:hypothetical protein EYF80_044426 [Liparis tanakae]